MGQVGDPACPLTLEEHKVSGQLDKVSHAHLQVFHMGTPSSPQLWALILDQQEPEKERNGPEGTSRSEGKF